MTFVFAYIKTSSNLLVFLHLFSVYSRFITVPSLLEITHTQNTTTVENEIIYQIQLPEEQQVGVVSKHNS